MSTIVVVASGESVNQEVVDKIKHLRCIAVSDAYTLLPDAEMVVAADAMWWLHPKKADALKHSGKKFCCNGNPPKEVRKITHAKGITTDTNSGLVGLHLAVCANPAKVLILGIDMIGTHFFGAHPEEAIRIPNGSIVRLHNTNAKRFEYFKDQFRNYAHQIPANVEVFNCSEISTLDVFPKRKLEEMI